MDVTQVLRHNGHGRRMETLTRVSAGTLNIITAALMGPPSGAALFLSRPYTFASHAIQSSSQRCKRNLF
eukprot:1458741-Amphidinium_carterae.1